MTRNIFDNKVFFESYMELRSSDINYNELLEQPAMRKLLPDLRGKAVLDLGCGFGENCRDFVSLGADRVTGLDISQKMLAAARERTDSDNICYMHMDMTDISKLNTTFDFIYSSLAFHYIEDFAKLAKDIYSLLNPGGRLLFSQEHPIATATINGLGHYNLDSNGEAVSYTMADYSLGGKRAVYWYVDGVEKYHRTMGEIITALARAGFHIEEMDEPVPGIEAIQRLSGLKKEFIKPSFMIIKAVKI